MVPRVGSRPEARRRSARQSTLERAWWTAAGAMGAVFALLAILQSPTPPLLALVAGLTAGGGLLVRAAPATARGRRPYVPAVASVAGVVLVVVGVGHHPSAGLAAAAVLLAVSPWTLRWISGR